MRLLLDALPVAISHVDRNECYRFNNAAFETLFHIERSAAQGRLMSAVLPASVYSTVAPHVQAALRGEEARYLFKVPVHGQMRSFDVRYVPDVAADGHVAGMYIVSNDITEEKAVEEKMRQQQAELAHVQRLAAVGETAAALAHEINQPLAAIVSYVDGASLRFQKEIANNPALGAILHQTGRIARRAADVVRNLRGFARKSDGTFEPVHVNQAVREAVQLVEPQATRQGMSLRMNLTQELPLISGDQVQIEQLLVNLLGNGLEAMEDTATGVRHMTVTTGLTADGAIEICIRDRGPGIDASAREHLFIPFFTTKKKGLGIGLSVCRSIVERHGGQIWVEDADGPGALFHVVLPSAQQEMENGD